jgi:hypothetical protein
VDGKRKLERGQRIWVAQMAIVAQQLEKAGVKLLIGCALCEVALRDAVEQWVICCRILLRSSLSEVNQKEALEI